jgi:hypothetical protein
MASVADSRFKQRAVIEFLVHENESVVNIYKRLCAVYGSCAVDRSTVVRWTKRVKASRSAETELRDLPRVGRPATPELLNCADAIIRADWRITTRQWALQLSTSTGSVCSIIETLGYSKVCSKWAPLSPTAEHKIQWKTISSEFLERFHAEEEAFLSRIVTGDETWVHHFEPETKRQ